MTPLLVPKRPATWGELAVAFLVGLLVGLGLAVFVPVRLAQAGGAVVVSWDQSADCPTITGWEVALAPVTAAQPNPLPTTAALGASIANTGTPPCGLGMTKTVTVGGVGVTRVWLRAVAAGGTKSLESNAVDVSLPLARPAGLTVAIP